MAIAVIRPAVWKGGLGAFQATLAGVDFVLVKELEAIAREEVEKLRKEWPIGPERNRPHSINLFRIQRRRRKVVVFNAAPYANFIDSPRTIGRADARLEEMVDTIAERFAKRVKVVRFLRAGRFIGR